jgi:membrane protein implicated in regulation of membrane protease activity
MGHIFMFMSALALAFFLFFPFPIALAAYMPIALTSIAIAYKAMKALRQPPANGLETFIGKQAVVVSTHGNEFSVRYLGEIWRAKSACVLQSGQRVVIQNVNGLTLFVMPLVNNRVQDSIPKNPPNELENARDSES